jgi:hypothetical protein
VPLAIYAGKHQLALVEGKEQLYLPDGSDLDPNAQTARDAANAYLMAAAPELLAACRGFLACFDFQAVPAGSVLAELRELACAAVARAEGTAGQ